MLPEKDITFLERRVGGLVLARKWGVFDMSTPQNRWEPRGRDNATSNSDTSLCTALHALPRAATGPDPSASQNPFRPLHTVTSVVSDCLVL